MTDKKIVTRNALEFLRTHDVGVVASVGGKGQPFVSPVYYAEVGDFNILFLTTSGTKKSQNIMENDKVAFAVGFGPEYTSVTIRGRAKLASEDEYGGWLAIIKDKAALHNIDNWPIRKLDELKRHHIYLYKIEPEEVTFLNIDSKVEMESLSDHLHTLV